MLYSDELKWRRRGEDDARHGMNNPPSSFSYPAEARSYARGRTAVLRQKEQKKKEKAAAIFETKRRKIDEVRAGTRQELRAILSAEQLPRFEKMEEEWDRRRRSRR